MHFRQLLTAGIAACGFAVVSSRGALAQAPAESPRVAAQIDTSSAPLVNGHLLPRPGQIVRIIVPGLPLREGHLSGTFTGVDSTAKPWMVMLTTPAGARSVPCANIESVDVRVDHHIARWQQVTVIAGSAVAGWMTLHYFVHNQHSYDVYGNPTPWTAAREWKERQRTMIAGVLLGGGTGWVMVHDRGRWQPASLGSCAPR